MMHPLYRSAGILALCLTLTACQQELLKQLDQNQANEVLATLSRFNINAAKRDAGKTGFVIEVDKADFAAAVALLKTYDLPSRKRVEIAEFFPADALVSSPNAERARLYSAFEQRLEQSLLTISSMVSARVHISYPLEARAGAPLRVSVLANVQSPGDTQMLIGEIKRFIKNSVDNVEYDNISVVMSPVTPPSVAYATPPVSDDGASAWLLGLIGVFSAGALGAAGLWWRRGRRVARESEAS
jgi:type III secretion protein J